MAKERTLASNRELRRQIGFTEATSLGIGGVIGAGIFVLSGVASGQAGPAVIISFLLAFLASVALGFCYSELTSLFPEAGGPYAFVREAFGPLAGGLIGWAFWGAWVAASGYVTLGFGNYLEPFTGLPPVVGACALIVVFTLLNLLGIKISGRVQIGITLVVTVALVAFVVIGIPSVDASRFVPFAPNGMSGILGAALIGFLALTGWDVIVVAAEEISDARRNIPLAIFSSLAVVSTLYIGLLIVANGVMSWEQLGGSGTPISDASERFLGDRGPVILSAIILVALTATANSFLIAISRTAFAMARDDLVPAWLAKTFGTNTIPWVAILTAGVAELLVAILGSISFSTSATGFLYLLTFMAPVVALLVTRRRGRIGAFRTPGYPFTPILALIACGGILTTSGQVGIVTGIVWLLIGFLVLWARGVRPSTFPTRRETEDR